MNLNDIKNKIGKSAGNVQFLLILLIIVLFTIVSMFMYKRYVSTGKKYITNNEFNSQPPGAITTADIYFFYTEWCPHCKTAKPVWADFKEQMNGKKVNGVSLVFIEVDCEKEKQLADQFNVKGYPTIKLVNNNQVIEYDAKPSKETLTQFLNTVL